MMIIGLGLDLTLAELKKLNFHRIADQLVVFFEFDNGMITSHIR